MDARSSLFNLGGGGVHAVSVDSVRKHSLIAVASGRPYVEVAEKIGHGKHSAPSIGHLTSRADGAVEPKPLGKFRVAGLGCADRHACMCATEQRGSIASINAVRKQITKFFDAQGGSEELVGCALFCVQGSTDAGDVNRLFFFLSGWEKRAKTQTISLAEEIVGEGHEEQDAFDFHFDVKLRNEGGFVHRTSYELAVHIVKQKDSRIVLLRYSEAEIPNAMVVRAQAVLHEADLNVRRGRKEAEPFEVALDILAGCFWNHAGFPRKRKGGQFAASGIWDRDL